MGIATQLCRLVMVPGPAGKPGVPGTPGTAGSNAWASLTADYTMPAFGASADAAMDHTDWLAVGLPVFVETLGTLQVAAILGPTSVTLLNLADGTRYAQNAPPGTVAPATVRVAATGFQGP